MTREERLAREAAIISKSALMNTLEVLRQSDRTLEAFDKDDARIAVAIIRANSAAAQIIELIHDRGWE